jgi:hypothetical protein
MKNKKAAMEMSVGTLVTIVLLMAVLILGIFLVQKIFSGGTDAIESINTQVTNQINQIFSDQETKLAVAPSSRAITLKRGDTPKGFAFSVRNQDVNDAQFSYVVNADDISKCGSLTKTEADSYLLGGTGSFPLGRGNSLDLPRLVRFTIPDGAPPCTIIYNLVVNEGSSAYSSAQIFVTLK